MRKIKRYVAVLLIAALLSILPASAENGVFALPSALTEIGKAAFAGNTTLKEIVIPADVTRIGSRAFAGCTGLESITILGNVESIADDALEGCLKARVYCFSGSAAQQYAEKNSVPYTLIDADYSLVDTAIAEANALDRDAYVDFSAVDAAVAGVVRGLANDMQSAVNGYAAAIRAAITALEPKNADYSSVDALIEMTEALDRSQIGDLSGLDAAVAAVVRGKNAAEQAIVDGYAAAIMAEYNAVSPENAVLFINEYVVATGNQSLTFSEGYEALIAQIVSAVRDVMRGDYLPDNYAFPRLTLNFGADGALWMDAYPVGSDYMRADNADMRSTNVNAVAYCYVNGLYRFSYPNAWGFSMRTVIQDEAKRAFESEAPYRHTDWSRLSENQRNDFKAYFMSHDYIEGVDDISYEFNLFLREEYGDDVFARVNERIISGENAIVYDEADAFFLSSLTAETGADVFTRFIDEWAVNCADYSAVRAAVNEYYEKANGNYLGMKAVEDAVSAVVYELPKSEQTRVDGYAAAINAALAALTPSADYTAVRAISNRYYTRTADYFNAYAFENALIAVDYELPESEQAKVDAYAEALTELEALLVPILPEFGNFRITDPSAKELCLTQYTASALSVVFPESINGYAVVKIGDNAFKGIGALTIEIPGCVREIGENAFEPDAIIIAPEGSAASEYASDHGLTYIAKAANFITEAVEGGARITGYDNIYAGSITIPDEINGEKVIDIADGAFSNCLSLKAFDVETENDRFIALDGMLYRAPNMALIACPPAFDRQIYSLPDSARSIGKLAFANNRRITYLTIPEGVTSIGERAFMKCKLLRTLVIAESVKQIGSELLLYCDMSVAFYGYEDSVSERYAYDNQIPFGRIVPVEPYEPEPSPDPTQEPYGPAPKLHDGKAVNVESAKAWYNGGYDIYEQPLDVSLSRFESDEVSEIRVYPTKYLEPYIAAGLEVTGIYGVGHTDSPAVVRAYDANGVIVGWKRVDGDFYILFDGADFVGFEYGRDTRCVFLPQKPKLITQAGKWLLGDGCWRSGANGSLSQWYIMAYDRAKFSYDVPSPELHTVLFTYSGAPVDNAGPGFSGTDRYGYAGFAIPSEAYKASFSRTSLVFRKLIKLIDTEDLLLYYTQGMYLSDDYERNVTSMIRAVRDAVRPYLDSDVLLRRIEISLNGKYASAFLGCVEMWDDQGDLTDPSTVYTYLHESIHAYDQMSASYEVVPSPWLEGRAELLCEELLETLNCSYEISTNTIDWSFLGDEYKRDFATYFYKYTNRENMYEVGYAFIKFLRDEYGASAISKACEYMSARSKTVDLSDTDARMNAFNAALREATEAGVFERFVRDVIEPSLAGN